jgi:L-2-hydroxyglutarate oxidase LhgO
MKVKCVTIGGGVIGLAIARMFCLSNVQTLVLEAREDIGLETSFRNSAVIHAGLYYPTNSLKAKFCVRGKDLIYEYCEKNSIPYKKIGKLIVATSLDQLSDLSKLYQQAISNDVSDVKFLSQEEIKLLEPNVKCVAGLFSPSTGILNGSELMAAFKKDILENDGSIICDSKFMQGAVEKDGFSLQIENSSEIIECKYLINAAGLWAQEVARELVGMPLQAIPGIFYAKGNYFRYDSPKVPFARLIYPLPEKAGLGIHATLDLSNIVRFGPDVEWVNEIDYSVSANRRSAFAAAIKNYFPAIKAENLQPEYAGIRPKSQPEEFQPQDFEIQTEVEHGIPNLVNLYGMESPGLTSSLAIAEEVYKYFHHRIEKPYKSIHKNSAMS